MKYCITCLQPNTRVNEQFSEDGKCSSCINFEFTKNVNYLERFDLLKEIISKYPRKKGSYYDCIIGVSGGKDSTRQAIWIRDKLKLNPLLVCLSYPPEQVSELGVKNISNLIHLGFDVLFSGPAPGTWKKLMRHAFLTFSNWAKSTEMALYSSVPKTAIAYKIPLIFIGENQSLRDRKTIDPEKPWEYNNLISMNTLGGGDLTWMKGAGFTDVELISYGFPDKSEVNSAGLNVIDLGWFIDNWDNLGNAMFSTAYGIHIREDKAQNTGDPLGVSALDEDWVTLNQMIKFLKFGFGKVTDYMNEDIRAERISREKAIKIVEKYDGACSEQYIESFCKYIEISISEFWEVVHKSVNKSLFDITADKKIVKKIQSRTRTLKRIKIAVLDYEVGNHASVKACLDKLGFIVQITSDISEIKLCDLLIMPGVGAFPVAIQSLVKKNLNSFLNEWFLDGRPLFGICLGMQMFANSSTEIAYHEGLGFIQGNVTPLSNHNDFHIGWNQLSIREANSFLSDFDGLDFYFNHSFAYDSDIDASLASTKYIREFPSIVKHGQVLGVQFHPEKSQNVGKEFFRELLRN